MVVIIESYPTTYESVPPDADDDGNIVDDYLLAGDGYNPSQLDQINVIVDQYDPFVIRRANPISEVDDEDDETIVFKPQESVSLCWENSLCRQEDDAAALAFDQNDQREYYEQVLRPQTPQSHIVPFECRRDDIFIHNDGCCGADDATNNSSVEYGARVSPTERSTNESNVSENGILKSFMSYFLAVLTTNHISIFTSQTDKGRGLTSPVKQSNRQFFLYGSLTKGMLFIVLGCIVVFGTSVLSSKEIW